MIKLTIFKPNGDVHWIEFFKTEAKKDSWLIEERARTNWHADFTTLTEVIPDPVVVNPAYEAAMAKIKSLRGQSLTTPQVKEAVEAMLLLFKF